MENNTKKKLLHVNIKELVRLEGNTINNNNLSPEETRARIDEAILLAIKAAEQYCNAKLKQKQPQKYKWNPTNPNLPAPPTVTTYGVMAVPDAKSLRRTLNNFPSRPINPQSSTHVVRSIHPEMLKPGTVLSDIQIADVVFPADNESVSISANGRIGEEDFNAGMAANLNDAYREALRDTREISKRESDFDIGLAEFKNTVTEKWLYQEVPVNNPQTGKVDKILFSSRVREEKSYKAIEPDGIGALEEERNVYVDDKLVVSQYRVGAIVGKDIAKARLSKNIEVKVGLEAKFDTPWINNPIPKQEDAPPPTISEGY